jgi:hypothetical protein
MSERDGGPTRRSDSLADVVEMLLDKGVVINADIAVSVGDTELLGVQLRAALASFETAAEYGLEFPDGTDMRRVEAASDRTPIEEVDEDDRDEPSINQSGSWLTEPPITSDESEGEDGDENPPPEPGVGARPRMGGRSRTETDESGDEDGQDDNETSADEDSDDED